MMSSTPYTPWNPSVFARMLEEANWQDPGYGRELLDQEPVVCLDWTDTKAYTDWLSAKTGESYRLLSEAESFARENGAVIAFFKTVEARVFYEKHGYQVYGVLEDRPVGTQLFHMKKRLDD